MLTEDTPMVIRPAKDLEHWNSRYPKALWVPQRLDIGEPVACILRRTRTYTIFARVEHNNPNWPQNRLREFKAKARVLDLDSLFGAFFDEQRPPWHGVDASNARQIFEQRLSNWRHYAEVYRSTNDKENGQLKGGFESFPLDPLVHDQNWFHQSAKRRYGVVLRKNQWFWTVEQELFSIEAPCDGFAATEADALHDSAQYMLTAMPRDVAWVRDDNVAKSRYQYAHARKTNRKGRRNRRGARVGRTAGSFEIPTTLDAIKPMP
jgi:hypothetical protein